MQLVDVPRAQLQVGRPGQGWDLVEAVECEQEPGRDVALEFGDLAVPAGLAGQRRSREADLLSEVRVRGFGGGDRLSEVVKCLGEQG